MRPEDMTWRQHATRAEKLERDAAGALDALEGVEMDRAAAAVRLQAIQVVLAQAQVHATLAVAKR